MNFNDENNDTCQKARTGFHRCRWSKRCWKASPANSKAIRSFSAQNLSSPLSVGREKFDSKVQVGEVGDLKLSGSLK